MITDIVDLLINLYKTRDPFELCRHLKIEIIFSDLGNEINGFFQKTPNGYKIIHINSRLDEGEKKYICAHELGHATLHTDVSIVFFINNKLQIKNRYEIEADKFAAELLIDYNANAEEYANLSIDQICCCLCIPTKLMRYKYNLDL